MNNDFAGFLDGYKATENYSNSFTIDSIEKIIVYLTNATDKVRIITNLPSPFPKNVSNDNLTIEFSTQADHGEEYVKNIFKRTPLVVNIR
jgi:hypothetical protein